MTRHQRWLFALAATIATTVLIPAASPGRILATAAPTLWAMAYIAHRCDLLTARVDHAEERLTGQVDTAVADIVIACKPPPAGNQRDHHHRGRGDRPLQSI